MLAAKCKVAGDGGSQKLMKTAVAENKRWAENKANWASNLGRK
jgi:hypothetical protein